MGIYRWQNNLTLASTNAQQARVQQLEPASNATVVSAISATNASSQTTIPAVTSVQTSAPVPVNNQPSINSVVVTRTDEPDTNSVSPNVTDGNAPLFGSYTVVSGDYLSKIAQQYGTDVKTIQDINNLSGTVINVGQEILLPLPAN